ncbi:Uncharacterised protein [Ewingella americana]|uniref:Uncharacterized protein n=1 Tax=Ewingella americana TaxID=41202 RepID=A0A377NBG2_9GAMM|nr:Uncharacterised protein [Ewingella americana]
MKYVVVLIIFLVALLYAAPWITERVPSRYNPFTPLSVNDPPNVITKYKLRRLDNNPEACLSVLDSAEQEGGDYFHAGCQHAGELPIAVCGAGAEIRFCFSKLKLFGEL